MTYCIGWKTKKAAFLIADSAVTKGVPVADQLSTFGEKHGEVSTGDERQFVSESALKIYRFGNSALTYSGDVTLGQKISHYFEIALERTLIAYDAFKEAVEVAVADSPPSSVRVILAHHSNGEPALAEFDWNGSERNLRTGDDVYQIGSIDGVHRAISKRFLELVPHATNHPAEELVQVLGLMQSYGVFSPLVEQRVGGTFTGVYVDQSGTYWQPDILNVLHESATSLRAMVGTFIRDDTLIVISSFDFQTKCFTNTRRSESIDACGRRIQTAHNEAAVAFHNGRFEFVTFLNIEKQIITSLEMRRLHDHKELVIQVPEDGHGMWWFNISTRLADTITRIPPLENGAIPKAFFNWCPYQPFSGDRHQLVEAI